MLEEATLELVDTHTHLEEVEALDQVLKRAERAGVSSVITMGSDDKSNRWALKYSKENRLRKPKVYCALGIHPWGLDQARLDSALNFIERNIKKAVCVGEIGLDYWIKEVRKDPRKKILQRDLYTRLLEIARRHDKPVSIHSRGAWADSLETALEVGVDKAVFHWFSGPIEVLKKLLRQDYLISATPAAAYSKEHGAAVKMTPLERLLLETDTPVRYRGETSEPAHVAKSLEAISDLKSVAKEMVARITTENAKKTFGI
jgi:TatD DNase family protein